MTEKTNEEHLLEANEILRKELEEARAPRPYVFASLLHNGLLAAIAVLGVYSGCKNESAIPVAWAALFIFMLQHMLHRPATQLKQSVAAPKLAAKMRIRVGDICYESETTDDTAPTVRGRERKKREA